MMDETKRSARLLVSSETDEVELVLWESGEAEFNYGQVSDACMEHQELGSVADLRRSAGTVARDRLQASWLKKFRASQPTLVLAETLSDQVRDNGGGIVGTSVDTPTLREPCYWKSQACQSSFASRRSCLSSCLSNCLTTRPLTWHSRGRGWTLPRVSPGRPTRAALA